MSIRSEFVRLWNEFMASAKKITQLTSLPSPVANSDLFEVVRGGVNYKALGSQLPSGGGGGSVVSVTGDFVDNTDPTNPVITGLQAALDLKANELMDPGTAKTANFALVLTDKDSKGLVIDSATPINVTIQPNSIVAMPRGAVVLLTSIGAGVPVFVAGAGVTLNPSSGSLNFPDDPYTPVFGWQREIDEWDIWNGAAGGNQTLEQVLATGNNITSPQAIVVDSSAAFAIESAVETDLNIGVDENRVAMSGPDNAGIEIDAGGVINIVAEHQITINADAGTAGQVLTSAGPSDPPVWASVFGVQDLFISAAAMWPRTTGPCADLAKTEIATSLFNIQSLDFDQTTQEFAQFQIVLPRKWNNGTVTAVFYWTAAAGSGDVQWGISGGAYSNDDALTVALGSAITVDDTLIATNDLHITAATAAITLAGTPADADFLAFQISRNPASDTLSADAKLLGVSIRITTDSAIDA